MKKKILFCSTGLGLGGVEKVLLGYLKNLDRKKYELELLLLHGNENMFEYEIPKDISYSYIISEKLYKNIEKFKKKKKNIFYKLIYNFYLVYEKYLIKKSIKNRLSGKDIVIDFKNGSFFKYLKKYKNIKKIMWLHGDIRKLNKYKERKNDYFKRINSFDKIVCICEDMKKILIEEYKCIKDEKVKVLYNIVPFLEIEKYANKTDEVKDLEVFDSKYFIFVGRLVSEEKDYDTLFDGYKKYVESGGENLLYIVGDGQDKQYLKEEVLKKGLKNKIVFLGRKNNPYVWTKRSEGLILSSKSEGLPTVLIEALILGKKVLSSDCPTGPREILKNGKNGELFKVGDSEELSKKLFTMERSNYNIDISEFQEKQILKKFDEMIINL